MTGAMSYVKVDGYDIVILHRGCHCVFYYSQDDVAADEQCSICDDEFGFSVPITIDEEGPDAHLSCVMEAAALRLTDMDAALRFIERYSISGDRLREIWKGLRGSYLVPEAPSDTTPQPSPPASGAVAPAPPAKDKGDS